MSEKKMQHEKMYVLDTNVLLHDPRAIYSFQGASIGVPILVLEELEKFKKETSERGKNAREFIRQLDKVRKDGSLAQGVTLENGATLKILFVPDNLPTHPSLSMALADNEILFTVLGVQKSGTQVVFITKDLNARVKADVLGLESEDYLKGHVPKDEFFKGWVRLLVPSIQLKKEIPDDLAELQKEYPFTLNEYVLVESQHNPHNNKLFRYVGGPKPFRPVIHPKLQWDLGARNPQQLMALDALFDPTIEFVTLLGPAGTGKTFMALLAGLHQVIMDDTFQKMMVSRPVVPLGPDIGYLPGDLQEKMHSWMQPIYDNVDVLLHASLAEGYVRHDNKPKHENNEEEFYMKDGKKHKKRSSNKKSKQSGYSFSSVEDLVSQDRLAMEAITYMRGRSIPYQFILIDEVQNLSPHEAKTIVSRVGQGSKIVLCGDPYQIDSPYMDFSSNGLVVSSDKFKGQDLFATVYLESSERSRLSELASKLL